MIDLYTVGGAVFISAIMFEVSPLEVRLFIDIPREGPTKLRRDFEKRD
jgi:hypothetical protein